MQIALVEDNVDLNEMLCETLRTHGYAVQGFVDAESFLESKTLSQVRVLIADIQLPGEDGLSLSRRVRGAMPHIAIMILTTHTSNVYRIQGYDAGADFYLPKPISPDELVTAVESLIRRKTSRTEQSMRETAMSPVVVDREAGVIRCGTKVVKVSATDLHLLCSFALAPSGALARWRLLELLDNGAATASNSALDVRLFRLRAKLSEVADIEDPIANVRGVGYRVMLPIRIDG